MAKWPVAGRSRPANPTSRRSCILLPIYLLQVRDLVTEVELERACSPEAAFTGFGHLLECCRRPQEPAEGRLRRLKRDLVGQAALIEDRLGGIQRLAIE